MGRDEGFYTAIERTQWATPYQKMPNFTRSGARKMEGVLESCFLIRLVSGGI